MQTLQQTVWEVRHPSHALIGSRTLDRMCRSIKTLRTQEQVSDEEIDAAALQFVRKISGYRKPSRTNEAAFDAAVAEIAAASRKLLDSLVAR